MADGSNIEWTDASWNPVRGCSRVSEGCRHCYAEGVAARFSGLHPTTGKPLAYRGLARYAANGEPRWTGNVRMVPEHLGDPLRWQRPRRIFVNSMSDLFHEKLTNEQIAAVFGVMAAATQHIFQVLTKRAARLPEWFAWADDNQTAVGKCVHYAAAALFPAKADREARTRFAWTASPARTWPLPNVWLGVSAENQETFDERVPFLKKTPAFVRWVSIEPQIGPIVAGKKDLGQGSDCPECGWMVRVDEDGCCASCGSDAMWYGLDWVVVGGESGGAARPFEFSWAQSLRAQCLENRTAFFMKQAGACPRVMPGGQPSGMRTKMHTVGLRETFAYRFKNGHGGDPAEWPIELPREYPKAAP